MCTENEVVKHFNIQKRINMSQSCPEAQDMEEDKTAQGPWRHVVRGLVHHAKIFGFGDLVGPCLSHLQIGTRNLR
jgi:hypothetical protein